MQTTITSPWTARHLLSLLAVVLALGPAAETLQSALALGQPTAETRYWAEPMEQLMVLGERQRRMTASIRVGGDPLLAKEINEDRQAREVTLSHLQRLASQMPEEFRIELDGIAADWQALDADLTAHRISPRDSFVRHTLLLNRQKVLHASLLGMSS